MKQQITVADNITSQGYHLLFANSTELTAGGSVKHDLVKTL